ncbi:MAG: PAS domain S-box protein [Cyclobacteriaceae bacterium]|nr:PAS domain S-box protein [Cyclobacteriaceae bacterium]
MNIQFQNKKELNEVKERFNNLTEQIKEASNFINEVEKGNLEVDISKSLLDIDLGTSLLSMKKHLSSISNDEKTRNWSNVGLAKFSDILRNEESLKLMDITDNILMNLVKYVEANQGTVFVLEGEGNSEEHLSIISTYAYDRKKFIKKRIEIGEGLVGQCFLEKQTIFLTDVPSDYIAITSGLGKSTPKSVIISPLLINEKVFGVIELASLQEFAPHHIDFIEKLSESIAVSIKNIRDSEKTQLLLRESQQQAEELRAQEEEMRQNMEEMQATQEEMARKSDELNKATSEMTSVLNGINSNMATIEFTPDGMVLDANDNFLKTVKYTLGEIKGQHHRKFVPKEIVKTEEYNKQWKRLASGEAIKGIFKRISSEGSTIWLNAIYTPIKNAKGEVEKVVKFATDISVEQEMLAENEGMISGINAIVATIEFTPEGTIISANDNFLKTVEYSIDEIKGKHHRIFVPEDIKESDEYKTQWSRLASGEALSGEFKRISSTGKEVWLNAIYNPIRNANGDVAKVVKFATEIKKDK